MAQNRNKYLDEVKGIAAILVVYGHTIQYGNGANYLMNKYFYSNIIYKAIYSFHMPLFAIIAGYLLSKSLHKRGSYEVLTSRMRSLEIPIITWSIINFGIRIRCYGSFNSIKEMLKQYIWVLIGTHWFLWAILFCTISVIFIHQLCKDFIWAYVIVLLLGFVIPDEFNLSYFKFLYPFFVGGYLWEKNNCKTLVKNDFALLGGAIIGWCLLLVFFKEDVYIYESGFCILKRENLMRQIFIDVFRIVVGVCGSIIILIGMKKLKYDCYISKVLILFGKNSLGIYIINSYVNLYILKRICLNWEWNGVRTILITGIVSIICTTLTVVISKCKVMNKLLLGGK